MSGGRDTAGEDPQLEWGGYDALGTDPRTLRAVIGRLEGELRDEQRARHDAERQLARARHRSAPLELNLRELEEKFALLSPRGKRRATERRRYQHTPARAFDEDGEYYNHDGAETSSNGGDGGDGGDGGNGEEAYAGYDDTSNDDELKNARFFSSHHLHSGLPTSCSMVSTMNAPSGVAVVVFLRVMVFSSTCGQKLYTPLDVHISLINGCSFRSFRDTSTVEAYDSLPSLTLTSIDRCRGMVSKSRKRPMDESEICPVRESTCIIS